MYWKVRMAILLKTKQLQTSESNQSIIINYSWQNISTQIYLRHKIHYHWKDWRKTALYIRIISEKDQQKDKISSNFVSLNGFNMKPNHLEDIDL